MLKYSLISKSSLDLWPHDRASRFHNFKYGQKENFTNFIIQKNLNIEINYVLNYFINSYN